MPDRFPDGARVLHIGPFKTGTTTMQSAFHHNRESLEAQAVHYVGRGRHPMVAAMGAAAGEDLPGRPPGQGLRRWQRLVAEIEADRSRATVLSSEFFSEAPPERIAAIADDLGPDRIQVVVTLRPLVRILASQWQQFMQNRPGLRDRDVVDFEEWLNELLSDIEHPRITPAFWRRHRHDRLVHAWADVVGADRVTVIAVDDSDNRMLPHTFEELLGLQDGTLVPHLDIANRSLTRPEVEVLRAFNEEYVAHGWSAEDYTRLVRFGAVRHLQERVAPADEARLLLPRWAVNRASGIGADMVQGIRANGVRVIGDLDVLGDPAAATAVGDNPPLDSVPPEIVGRFAAGLIRHVCGAVDEAGGPDATGPIQTAARDYIRPPPVDSGAWTRVTARLGRALRVMGLRR